MTISISLGPETEKKLRELAAQRGQSVEGYVRELVEKSVGTPDGGQELAPAAQEKAPDKAGRTFAEIFSPVQQEFHKSGMTEGELDALLEECRDEVWQEKQTRKGS